MMDAKLEFSVRLNQALDDIGFPAEHHGRQTTLARRMGVTQKGAAKWLKGEAMPTKTRLIELSKLVNRSVEWLLTGNGPTRPQQFVPQEQQYLIDFWNGLTIREQEALYHIHTIVHSNEVSS